MAGLSISITQLKELEAKILQQQAEIDALKRLVGSDSAAGVAFLAGQPTDVSLNSGDTAWILTASCLVLMMTVPGLALFYGESWPSLCIFSCGPLSHIQGLGVRSRADNSAVPAGCV